MNRAAVIVTFVLAGLISASVFLVIRASDDRPPALNAELPRDQQQEQQEQEQQSEPEPDPAPEDEADEAESADDSEPSTTSEQGEQEQDTPTDDADDPAPAAAPAPVDVLIRALEIERPPIPAQEPAPAPPVIHTIQRGETLTHIAARYQIKVSQLAEANDLDRTTLLRVGRELLIPITQPAPQLAPEPVPEPVEVPPAITDNGIIYGTIRNHERNVVDSAVVAAAQTHATVHFVEACIDGVRRTYVMGLPLPDGPTRIYWRIDNGPLNSDRWIAAAGLLESTRWYPMLDEGSEAHTLWLRLADVDLTFTLEHPLPDEIAHNFDICTR